MTNSPLSKLFLDGVSPDARATLVQLPNLEERLKEVLELCRQAFADINISPEDFLPFWAARVGSDAKVEKVFEEMEPTDLYLACALARGESKAMAFFVKTYLPEVSTVLSPMNLGADVVEDVKQLLCQKLFSADDDGTKKIVLYAGCGSLRSWLRAVAIREAIDLLRKQGKEKHPGGNDVEQIQSADMDPELQYLKGTYRVEFEKAFRDALRRLNSQERNILRCHLLEGINLDQIGVIYGVHRATVARWIVKIRKKLQQDTRQELMRCLKISRFEFESLARLVQSQINVSVRRYLDSKHEE